ncbi:GbsR/MarR family transcriptional regulator [Salinibacter ruber]|jgi:DNA-binding transcriptional regulator GbsR (MarR family)|uniref:GbsR/MarR family transcriptional regulator n=1 Tax=Salinibacter ruber TaxID=146919 RepID=UPI00216A8AB9|nr:MarR family transcriptional regulator [Salinibacter ruber]MCS3698356.1 DNA-binding transcriptional regulator GbsR (MarR family) [Salinibacter ruber]
MPDTQQHSSPEEASSESEVVSEKHQEKLQFAEEIGRILEDDGQPRIAGRILGWLMVCDPPYQSFDDLVDALDVSKGSISTMTRKMIDSGLVKRVTFPGDRKSYYQVRSEAWVHVLEQRLQLSNRFADVTKAGIKMMEDEPKKQQRRIREMHNFMVFFIKQMEEAIEDYESKFDDVIPETG